MNAKKLLEEARSAALRGEIGEAKARYEELIGRHFNTPEADAAMKELEAITKPRRKTPKPPPEPRPQPKPREIQRVVVTDVDVKFGTLVWLMVKIAIAAIPAAIILYLIAVAVLAALGLSFGRL